MLFSLALVVGILLAFANGANDDFKGVATLLGSRTAGYRRTLLWGVLTTLAGSLAAVFVATGLVARFSGKGLVPDEVVAEPAFALAAALAGGTTVLAATWRGLPVSTTHALVGGLVGAGLVATGGEVGWERMTSTILLPLLASPLVAGATTAALVPLARLARSRFGVEPDSCVCVEPPDGDRQVVTFAAGAPPADLRLVTGRGEDCVAAPTPRVTASRSLDVAHFLSGGALGFARGLNDAPKIAALLLFAPALSRESALIGVALAMALGGWLAARRVAVTISYGVTSMNAGQGFVANAVSSVLVLSASRFGLPVSTTHVSVGALFGLGAVSGGARWRNVASIALAWVVTLPVAATLGAIAYLAMRVG